MKLMKNRTGETVVITLHHKDGRNRKVNSEQEFSELLKISQYNLKTIFKKAASKMDFQAFFLIAKIAFKKWMGGNRDDERNELIERSGLDINAIEVVYLGKRFIAKSPKGMFFVLGMLNDVIIQNQYDVNEQNVKGKTVIDAGANTGFFSFMCAALGAKRVYAFEPVEETFRFLDANILENGLYDVVIPVKKAIGDEDTKVKIHHYGSCDASASIDLQREWAAKYTEEIEVVRLDSFLKKERVDFVKMDIEGYEEKALNGMAATLKAHKPILSFSAYHKPSDKLILPKTVLSIRQDYKIKLNRFEEEDFYCD